MARAQECRIFFFCGPDEAGAADAAARIAGLLGEAERVEMTGADLRRDPVRLADEARSVSLFGDRRQIHIRTAGDETFDAVETLLSSPVEGWPVLIVATSATDKSRVAKLLADRPDALVGMFHPPDMRAVIDSVRDMAGAAGLRMTGDLAERIARATALDTRMARSEIEARLYLDASPQPRAPPIAALDAVGAATEDDGMMPVVNAVLSGDLRRMGAEPPARANWASIRWGFFWP
jgi:DNA polymerase-3 subunit delta